MANYLERVVLSGARTAPQARPAVGAPPMLPVIQLAPVFGPMEPESMTPPSPPEIRSLPVAARHEEPTAQRAATVNALSTLAPRERISEVPLDPTPIEEPESVVSPQPQAQDALPAPAAQLAPIIVETVLPPPTPKETTPAISPRKIAAAQKVEPPKVTKAASPKPVAPLFFRFQQTPVHIGAPKELRPPKENSESAPAPHAPISTLFKAILTPPRSSKLAPPPARQPSVSPQKTIEAPMPVQAQKPAPVHTPVLAIAAPSQKRIHIGAVEVHVHNQTPPAPKAAAPRPAAVNHSDPFEQRSLNRFAFRL